MHYALHITCFFPSIVALKSSRLSSSLVIRAVELHSCIIIMARDEKHFFYFKTWHDFSGYHTEEGIGSGTGQSYWRDHSETIELRLIFFPMRKFSRMHKIGMFLPEEDDKLCPYIFFPDLVFFFPLSHLDWLRFFDERGTAESRTSFSILLHQVHQTTRLLRRTANISVQLNDIEDQEPV